jgi:hypothetical protein
VTRVLTYDAHPGDEIVEGDVVVSVRGRAKYLVLAARRVRSWRYPHRWRLIVDRHDELERPPDTPAWGDGWWPLYWHPRGRRS